MTIARGRPRIVVAPDSYRGSISAVHAADAIANGIEAVCPRVEVTRVPVADGGEGTVDCAIASGYRAHTVRVTGPLGETTEGRIATRRTHAVVELAELCGWARLGTASAPLDADTRGFGDGIRAALDLGCTDIVLGVGGSVSTDGGIGLLRALGAVTRDARGVVTRVPGGRGLSAVHSIDVTGLDPRLADVRFRLATDVDNPLVGPSGAAAVFGPQKGATAADVELLDAGLCSLADVVVRATGVRTHDVAGAGAAGGVGATVVPFLGAEIVSGADLVLDLVGFDVLAAGATWVITGEGRWDAQTGGGKAPARVAARGRAAGALVAVIAGAIEAAPGELARSGVDAACALLDLEPDVARCMADAGTLLAAAAAGLAPRLLERTVCV